MPPTLSPSTVSCSIDLQASGKRVGHLRINKITNTAGWASTFIHIGCVVNGAGPTVLVLAGNHGDEYEGQVAAMRLLQELQAEQVTGRVIVIPLLSPGASKANTRNWPSGANFNRSFPGRPDGPPHEQLADYLTRVLFPMADVVIDMHSGGRSAWFLPCSHMHVVDDPAQRKAMLEAMEAWCTDHHYLYIDVNGNGLLPVEAENQGKLVITTELGGGGRTPAPVHRLAWSGLNNVLRHVGVLEGQVQTRASMGLPPAVIIDGRDPGNIVVAPEDGMFEAMLEPGEHVAAGQPVGRLWFMDRPDRPAELLRSPVDGIVVVTKAIPITEQGDCVFVVGTRIDRAALL
jgi:predicted deacylase